MAFAAVLVTGSVELELADASDDAAAATSASAADSVAN